MLTGKDTFGKYKAEVDVVILRKYVPLLFKEKKFALTINMRSLNRLRLAERAEFRLTIPRFVSPPPPPLPP